MLILNLVFSHFLRIFSIIGRLLKNESLALNYFLLSFILRLRCHIYTSFCWNLRTRHRILILSLECLCEYIVLWILISYSLILCFFRLFTVIWSQILLLKIVLYSSTETCQSFHRLHTSNLFAYLLHLKIWIWNETLKLLLLIDLLKLFILNSLIISFCVHAVILVINILINSRTK